MNDTGNRGTGSEPGPPVLAGHLMKGTRPQQSTTNRQVSPSPSGSTSNLGQSGSRQAKPSAKLARSDGTSSRPDMAAGGLHTSNSNTSSKRQLASITQPEDLGTAASVVDGRALKKQKLAVEDNVSSTRASTSQTAGLTVAEDGIGSDAVASSMGARPCTRSATKVQLLSSSAPKQSTSNLPQATCWREGPRAPRDLKGVTHHSALGRRHTSQYFRL